MNAAYQRVAERARNRCEYCRAPEEAFNFPFEVEHIHPRVRGGADDLTNLALSCHACNRFKGEATTGVDSETEEVISLFHPRRDTWHSHFQAIIETGEMVGLTDVGRATIARLQMNRHQQRRARLHWVQLGLYP